MTLFLRRNIIAFILLLATLVAGTVLRAQQPERYQLVEIHHPSGAQLALLASLDADHYASTSQGIEVVLSANDVGKMRGGGAEVRVITENLTSYYQQRAANELRSAAKGSAAARSANAPANFTRGSVAGFYTLDELKATFAKMHQLYPNLASDFFTIGTSIQGRQIWGVRISSRPESDTTIPQILYTALHHAREPAGMTALTYTMWSLLEGYGANPEATYLLDHRALFIIPCVNPDGYYHNVATNPDGGGLWRRNMRDSGKAAVDINRNYGPDAYWNASNAGSSTSIYDDTYRGGAAFSEPETRAIRDFVLAHHFSIALNHHTYGNMLVTPSEFVPIAAADSLNYFAANQSLTAAIGFAPGNSKVSVGYPARGVSDDWLYSFGDTARHILCWSPETGSVEDGFWPAPSRIEPLAERDSRMDKMVAWMAGAYPRVTEVRTLFGSTPGIRITVVNAGRTKMEAGGSVGFAGEQLKQLPRLAPGERTEIDLEMPAPLAADSAVRYDSSITISHDGFQFYYDLKPFAKIPEVVFDGSFDDGLSKWYREDWGTETVAGRGLVLSDSPLRNYSSNSTNTISTRTPISLVGFAAAQLEFNASSIVEARNHDARIEVQDLSDGAWVPLDVSGMQISVATADSMRAHFRGANTQWQHYTANLDQYVGRSFNLRMTLEASASSSATFNGILIDSLQVLAVRAPGGTSMPNALQFNSYPNPFTDEIVIDASVSKDIEYDLYNSIGERVLQVTQGTMHQLIATPLLPSGYYELVARAGGQVAAKGIRLVR